MSSGNSLRFAARDNCHHHERTLNRCFPNKRLRTWYFICGVETSFFSGAQCLFCLCPWPTWSRGRHAVCGDGGVTLCYVVTRKFHFRLHRKKEAHSQGRSSHFRFHEKEMVFFPLVPWENNFIQKPGTVSTVDLHLQLKQ